MTNIDTLTVEDILSTKEMKVSNGETISGKQYFDDAISAFGLQPCDYSTVFKLLNWIAKGHDSDAIVNDINQFWQLLEKKYK